MPRDLHASGSLPTLHANAAAPPLEGLRSFHHLALLDPRPDILELPAWSGSLAHHLAPRTILHLSPISPPSITGSPKCTVAQSVPFNNANSSAYVEIIVMLRCRVCLATVTGS